MSRKEEVTEQLRTLLLDSLLEMHAIVWAKLKMAGLTTEQHDKDYLEFCDVLKTVHEEHGFNCCKKIDEVVPDNTWLPLFRKNMHLLSPGETNKGVRH